MMRTEAYLTGITKDPRGTKDKQIVRINLYVSTDRRGMDKLFELFEKPETKRVELHTRDERVGPPLL